MRHIKTGFILAFTLAAVACGGGDDGISNATDGGVDGGDQADAATAACTEVQDSYTPTTFSAFERGAGSNTWRVASGLEMSPTAFFAIDFEPRGDFTNGIDPGTYTIEGVRTSPPPNCDLCVQILVLNDAGNAIAKAIWAESGTVTVDAIDAQVGGDVMGSVTDLSFREIDMQGNDVDGGCQVTIPSASFSATFMMSPNRTAAPFERLGASLPEAQSRAN